MRWLMDDICSSSDFDLQLVVTGAHLSVEHGLTYREIKADGFKIDASVPISLDSSDEVSLSKSVGLLTGKLSEVFFTLRPDLVMVMGDRYELLAVQAACILSAIPIAHISGGEITEGAIDDQIRHAMTKVAHLHYVANKVYGMRVRQMGEERWRICVSGEPGLDNIYRQPMMTSDELSADLGLDLSKPTALVTYHPVTLEIEKLDEQMIELLAALEEAYTRFGLQYVVTYPNADIGSDRVIKAWKGFVDSGSDRMLIKSMGQSRYLSALRTMSMMIGNSSSGLVEAPSFSMPAVNIGSRQGGRMRANNVIDASYNRLSILKAISQALSWDRKVPCTNPYGDGRSSQRILDHLRYVFSHYDRRQILSKKFFDFKKSDQEEMLGVVDLGS